MTKHIFYPLFAGAMFLCAQSINAETLMSPDADTQEVVDQDLDLNLDETTDSFYGYGGYGLGYSGYEFGYALNYLCLYYPYLATCGGFGPSIGTFFGGFDGGWWGGRGRHHRRHHRR